MWANLLVEHVSEWDFIDMWANLLVEHVDVHAQIFWGVSESIEAA